MAQPLQRFGTGLILLFQVLGEMLGILARSLYWCRSAVFNARSVLKQMARVGWDTLPIGILMSVFIGMVMALQTGYALQKFGATSTYLPRTVALALVRELIPVFVAFLVAARVGASMAAELGTMAVSEEIDALRVLGINPVRYLAMPRLLACTAMLPVLIVYTDMIGMIGGGIVSCNYFSLTAEAYRKGCEAALDFMEIAQGLVKAGVFGMIISVVACHQGMTTTGGAEGVGRATTNAVVYSTVGIFVANFFITRFWMAWS
ncbi:MAG: ABC transporter permease [Planctomycetota bacterium]